MMKGKIQTITPEGDFDTNNVYTIALDNGTTAKCYAKKDSFKDKKFASGEAIGEEMTYEVSAKGNFSAVTLGDYTPSANGSAPKPYNGGGSYYKNSGQGNDSRQTSIVRQSMLKAAVEFLTPREGIKKEHIFELAESFEAWVTRVDALAVATAEQHLPRTNVPAEATPAPAAPVAPQPSLATLAEDDLPF